MIRTDPGPNEREACGSGARVAYQAVTADRLRRRLNGTAFGGRIGQMRDIPGEQLQLIEQHFHALIRKRAGSLLKDRDIVLPDLAVFLEAEEVKAWFPVPGMYGGFSYWFEGEEKKTRLVTESWCRVVEGSGQRHEVTDQGSRLLEQGFV